MLAGAKQASLEAAGTDMGSMESLWRDRIMNLEPLELRQRELQEEVGQLFAALQAQVTSTVDFSALLETGKPTLYVVLETTAYGAELKPWQASLENSISFCLAPHSIL